MSASDPNSKIDVLDDAETVKRKLKKAVAAPKIVEENGLLSFVEYVLLPAGALKTGSPIFEVPRREGEPLVYTSVQQLQDDYRADIVSIFQSAPHDYHTDSIVAVPPNTQASYCRRDQRASQAHSSRFPSLGRMAGDREEGLPTTTSSRKEEDQGKEPGNRLPRRKSQARWFGRRRQRCPGECGEERGRGYEEPRVGGEGGQRCVAIKARTQYEYHKSRQRRRKNKFTRWRLGSSLGPNCHVQKNLNYSIAFSFTASLTMTPWSAPLDLSLNTLLKIFPLALFGIS